MTNLKIFIQSVLAVLLVFSLMFAISYFAGMSLREMAVAIVAYSLYGLLLLAYAMRFALIFLGVFAVYRILQERHARRLAAHV